MVNDKFTEQVPRPRETEQEREPIRARRGSLLLHCKALGENPTSDKMRDHHHYHYLFAKQRPTLGPILIGFANYNDCLVFGTWMMPKEEGRVNARIKACIHLETSTDWLTQEKKKSLLINYADPLQAPKLLSTVCILIVWCVMWKKSCQTDCLKLQDQKAHAISKIHAIIAVRYPLNPHSLHGIAQRTNVGTINSSCPTLTPLLGEFTAPCIEFGINFHEPQWISMLHRNLIT